jgi:TonB-linked SusC/RagA family outer membrane protein
MPKLNVKRGLSILSLLILPLFIFAQSTTYSFSGKITEADGTPIVGAVVQLNELRNGAVTDLDGMYSFSGTAAEGNYNLRITAIGYSSMNEAIAISSANSSISKDVTLSNDALKLDEVIVTGSSLESSRRALGNAYTTVRAEQLEKTGSGNALVSLQGKVAGARITQTSGDPAGAININLRGINSIVGSSEPLYVIDGVVVNNSATAVTQTGNAAGEAVIGTPRLADLNPSDIENLQVLNGAAAGAIYGSRAANGVVLITTKRGISGKTKITFGTSVNINQLRKKVYISTYGKQFGSGANTYRLGNITPLAVTGVPNPNFSQIQAAYPSFTVDSFYRDGSPAFLTTNLVDVKRYDYQDEIFRTGVGNETYINFTGGNEKTKYFASGSYMANGGTIKTNDFNRLGLRLNLDQELASWAKISFGLNGMRSNSNDVPNGNVFWSPVNSINITNNIFDITRKDLNGNLLAAEPSRINPLSIIETFKTLQQVNRAITNAKLTIFPIRGMKVDFIAGLDALSQTGTQYIPVYPYSGVNTAFYASGFAANSNNTAYLYNTDLNLTYDHSFGSISSNTVLGYNYQNSRVDLSVSSGENLAPGIVSVNASPNRITSFGQDRFWVDGYFLQQTLGYKNQLFLTLASRVDNSSKFSKENRNQFFPKASISYILSDATFWKNSSISKIWSGMKLRASIGEAGGVAAINSYDRYKLVSSVNYLGKNTYIPNAQIPSANLKPERTRELEFGADLSFFKNKLSLSATYYTQNVFDLLVSRVVASTEEGATTKLENVGEMENKGIELNLNWNAMKTKNFNWDIYSIYSSNKNKVTKLGSPSVQIGTASGAPVFLLEGEAAGVFLGTYFAQDANGNRIKNKKGLEQSEKGTATTYFANQPIPAGGYVLGGILYTPQKDAEGLPKGTLLRKVIGNPNPDFTASLGMNFTYKSFGFGFLLDGVYGVDVFNADRRTRQGVGIGDYSEKEIKGELPRGYIFSIYPIEEWRVEDGSFTKIREVSFSYTLPKIMKGFDNITLSAIGRNIHSFDTYDGYDPETNAGGTSDRLRGVDFGNIPIPRTIQFALKANF